MIVDSAGVIVVVIFVVDSDVINKIITRGRLYANSAMCQRVLCALSHRLPPYSSGVH